MHSDLPQTSILYYNTISACFGPQGVIIREQYQITLHINYLAILAHIYGRCKKKSPVAERTDLFYKECFVYIVFSKKSKLNF
jgi:hypothetical protein